MIHAGFHSSCHSSQHQQGSVVFSSTSGAWKVGATSNSCSLNSHMKFMHVWWSEVAHVRVKSHDTVRVAVKDTHKKTHMNWRSTCIRNPNSRAQTLQSKPRSDFLQTNVKCQNKLWSVCVCDVAKFHPWYARTFSPLQKTLVKASEMRLMLNDFELVSTNHKVTQSKPEHQAFKKKLWRGRIQSFNIIPKPPGPSCGSCYLFRRFVRGTGRNWEKFSNDPHGSRGSRHPVGFVVDISLKWTSSRKKFPNTNLDWCDIAGLIGISMDFYNYDLWCVALEQTSNKKRLIQ